MNPVSPVPCPMCRGPVNVSPVLCPMCQAKPGRPCTTLAGDLRATVHQAREHAEENQR